MPHIRSISFGLRRVIQYFLYVEFVSKPIDYEIEYHSYVAIVWDIRCDCYIRFHRMLYTTTATNIFVRLHDMVRVKPNEASGNSMQRPNRELLYCIYNSGECMKNRKIRGIERGDGGASGDGDSSWCWWMRKLKESCCGKLECVSNCSFPSGACVCVCVCMCIFVMCWNRKHGKLCIFFRMII